MNAVKTFRIIALAEGISFLILLGIAMPLKYFFHWPDAVRFFGMAHGGLFVGFVIMAFNVMSVQNKNYGWFFMALLLSVLPFGTFYLDKKMKEEG